MSCTDNHVTAPDTDLDDALPPELEEPERAPPALAWRKHLLLFLATLLSVFVSGVHWASPDLEPSLPWLVAHLHRGWTFAVPLMAILLTHELGHYFAARYHRVPASLPYFIPLPILSQFGTMGAVITMPERIRSRDALLDIGAAGPLAGLVVAVPVTLIGLAQSEVLPVTGSGLVEGQCLLYSLLKHIAVGDIPAGHDVFLTPTALAGWTGLLVTALNLLPIGQLDGGHIAYALFDRAQHRIARVLHVSLLGAFVYNLIAYRSIQPGLVWVIWFVLLLVVGRDHPPTEPGTLSPRRRWVAWGCLALFVLLFMPTPMRAYDTEPAAGEGGTAHTTLSP